MKNELNDDNFLIFAIKHYQNPSCTGMAELEDDLKRFKYLKRLFNRYEKTGEPNERLIINHLVLLYNVFGKWTTEMLFYKLEEKYNFYDHWTINHRYGWFKFTYSIKKVNKLRINYQNKNNINYEWIILTSPQMEPQNNIDNLNLLNNKFMYSPDYAFFGGYYTSFLMGNSEHINYISEIWDYMIEKKFNNDINKNYIYFKKCLINSEPIFKQYIDFKYDMKPELKIRFNRIRYNGDRVNH